MANRSIGFCFVAIPYGRRERERKTVRIDRNAWRIVDSVYTLSWNDETLKRRCLDHHDPPSAFRPAMRGRMRTLVKRPLCKPVFRSTRPLVWHGSGGFCYGYAFPFRVAVRRNRRIAHTFRRGRERRCKEAIFPPPETIRDSEIWFSSFFSVLFAFFGNLIERG